MEINKDLPDPTIDWDYIRYNTRSDSIRPSAGWRLCTKCGNCLPINNYHFSKDRRNADGYSYQCKECQRKNRKSKKVNKDFSPSLVKGKKSPKI